ncbi:AAA family ATPase [Bacillus amyloliquefaciens]|uniref:deoxynucleotide monophosphate kinase family protein n=1 Tax=Bacillus subtilis group TaxID=653685 RepID=UPI0005EFFDE7|nr:hypothetical protein [Bacillus amyloliquefaciens]
MKIAVAGKMRSGKDTLAKFFIENDKAYQLAFGDGIKKVANTYFPHIVAQGKPRKLYQFIGEEFRKIDPYVWVNYLDQRMKHLGFLHIEDFVVSDVRQMNEYEYLKSKGFTVIKVEAADEIRRERIEKSGDIFEPEDFYHHTETAVDEIPCDYLVTNNDDLNAFYEQINFVYNELRGEQKV